MNFLVGLALVLSSTAITARNTKLGSYTVDGAGISVSGFSSGGFFAVQFHVAFSGTITGAGVMAGGPYYCTEGVVDQHLRCRKQPDTIEVTTSLAKVKNAARLGYIDNPSHLKNQKVFLFSGSKDTLVSQGTMRKLEQFYSSLGVQLRGEFSIPAEHSIVTADFGHRCSHLGTPYINNCNYSTPYHILSHIYGDITDAKTDASLDQNLVAFDQSEFFSGSKNSSLDTTGYIYVPSKCQDKSITCRLHVAFHGCFQSREFLDTLFVTHSQYNRLAETNDIIILYPQARTSLKRPKNQRACWDWWGFTGPNYIHQSGTQMSMVMNMIRRVANMEEESLL